MVYNDRRNLKMPAKQSTPSKIIIFTDGIGAALVALSNIWKTSAKENHLDYSSLKSKRRSYIDKLSQQ